MITLKLYLKLNIVDGEGRHSDLATRLKILTLK